MVLRELPPLRDRAGRRQPVRGEKSSPEEGQRQKQESCQCDRQTWALSGKNYFQVLRPSS